MPDSSKRQEPTEREREIYELVQSYLKEGLKPMAALRKAGVPSSVYYPARMKIEGAPLYLKGEKSGKPKSKPKVIQIETAPIQPTPKEEKLAVIIGSPADIADVLRRYL